MPRKQDTGPRSKEELLNKMLSFDFHGLPDLSEDVTIQRTSPQTVELTFPKLGRTYELAVRIPREEGATPEPDTEWTTAGPRPTRRRRQ